MLHQTTDQSQNNQNQDTTREDVGFITLMNMHQLKYVVTTVFMQKTLVFNLERLEWLKISHPCKEIK